MRSISGLNQGAAAEPAGSVLTVDITWVARGLRLIEVASTLTLAGVSYWLSFVPLLFTESRHGFLTTGAIVGMLFFSLWTAWKVFSSLNGCVSLQTALGLSVFAVVLSTYIGAQYFESPHENGYEINIGLTGAMLLLTLASLAANRIINRASVGENAIRIGLLLRDVDWSVTHHRPSPQKPALGMLYGLLAIALLTLTAFTPEPIRSARVFLYLGGMTCLFRARVAFQPTVGALREADTRALVLFLRSFYSDQKFNEKDQVHVMTAPFDFSLEHRLAEHFNRHLGPVIAVAKPEPVEQILGAARVPLSNDEWQFKVKRWMKEAQLIMLMSGQTWGVEWEMRQVIQSGLTHKLIILFPERPKENMWVQFWRFFGLKRSLENQSADDRLEHLLEACEGTPWSRCMQEVWNLTRRDAVMARDLRTLVLRPGSKAWLVHSRSPVRTSYHFAMLLSFLKVRKAATGSARNSIITISSPR